MKALTTSFLVLLLTGFVLLFGCKGSGNKTTGADSTAAAPPKAVPGTPIKYDSAKRYIFLTWDDAPQPPGTNNCKKVFSDLGVKATFFVVGGNAPSPSKVRIVENLRNSYPEFLIANHSYSHGFNNKYKLFYEHPDSAVRDFIHDEQMFNIPVKIIRLPGNPSWVGKGEMKGPKSTMKVCKLLDSMGYKVIGWDIEWPFVNKPHMGSIPAKSVDQMIKEVNESFESDLNNEPNTVVILAHDRMFGQAQYVDSLTKFVTTLKNDPRNVFETIDHYPLVQNK